MTLTELKDIEQRALRTLTDPKSTKQRQADAATIILLAAEIKNTKALDEDKQSET